MARNLITSLLSLATNLLPSITASAHAPSSSSSNSNNSERGRARAVKEDLEWLKRTLERIKDTLYDADEREIRDRSVKGWLKDLKEVAYDAENVLSEYQYEVTHVQIQATKNSEASGSHKRKQIEYIVPISDGMVDRLNKIRTRFDEIANARETLQLTDSDGVRRHETLRPPTSHMVDEASIFGRDAEITEVIDSILSEKEKSFSVISILGKGGLGKTTIAQLVYKDGRVRSGCFDLFGWVCVSEEFDVGRVTKAIIESVSKINYGLSELSSLQEKLVETVKGKTVLLVLDDVWNENQSLWELFRLPLKEAKMVRVLVTTRNKKVAEVMQTTTCFCPTNLPEDSCWQLFQHYAFSGTSDIVPTHLVDMGRKIMRKCGGLPLAVKSIASHLSHETDEESWLVILESDLWELKQLNDIIFPALQISYAHLPPYLKPCFLFCSMYPKDYEINKRNLIELWIANGYIESRGKKRKTEIGVEYYEELKKRSFLDDFSNDSGYKYCKLHDIIHDLARLFSENEHYSVEINQPLDIQKEEAMQKAYHLYVGGFVGYVPQNLKGVRTLFMDMRTCVRDSEHEHCIDNKEAMVLNSNLSGYYTECSGAIHKYILAELKFEALRILELNWYDLSRIPDSICELKHLAYLSITSPRLQMLPLSIGLLYNLQTLILDCFGLAKLPESIGDILNLQFLKVQSANLREIPTSLGSLNNLMRLFIRKDYQQDNSDDSDDNLEDNILYDVPHGHVNFRAIKTMKAWLKVRTVAWLKDMTDLEGNLSIYGVSTLKDAQRANMRNKCKLETLDLSWDPDSYPNDPKEPDLLLSIKPEACEDDSVGHGVDDAAFSWLESLQPHPNLKILRVKCYPSAELPGWISDPRSLRSIQEVSLENCYNILFLPFSNLHTLKYLRIYDCNSIQVLQLEQLPSKLEDLEIIECGNLELITGLGNLDMLGTLEIGFCDVLESITMDNPHIGQQSISSLTKLIIEYCPLLCVLPDGLIPSGPCSVSVHECGCPDLERN